MFGSRIGSKWRAVQGISRAVSCAGSTNVLTATNQEVAGSSPAGPTNSFIVSNLHCWADANDHLVNTTGNTIAAAVSRASPTCDVSSDSLPHHRTGRELRHQHHDLGPPVRHIPADA